MSTLKDSVFYLGRLVRDGVFLAGAIVDALGLIVKTLTPPTRRPAVLDESWVYLTVLAAAFVVAAYRLDRDLRAQFSAEREQLSARLSTERDKLIKELRERLIRLKFTVESRSKDPIPIDQVLMIENLAKDLGDAYVLAECEEIRNVIQRNYDSLGKIVYMFEQARRDYDSVRTRVDYVLKRLDELGKTMRSNHGGR